MTESQFANNPTSRIHLDDLDGSVSETEIIKILRNEAQRRGFRQPSNINGFEVQFSIELPDELTNITAPRFFISDRVAWLPLLSDDDPPDRGYVIGMKYITPDLEKTPGGFEGGEVGWNYLVYLAPESPSRQWTQTDWATENDLVLQESLPFGVSTTSKEGPNLES